MSRTRRGNDWSSGWDYDFAQRGSASTGRGERLVQPAAHSLQSGHRGLAIGYRAHCIADRRLEFGGADLLAARESRYDRVRYRSPVQLVEVVVKRTTRDDGMALDDQPLPRLFERSPTLPRGAHASGPWSPPLPFTW